MGLDVETPPPPDLREERDHDEYDDLSSEDYRREELEAHLEDGAWERGFAEWAEHTDLDEAEFEVARDLSLFRQFDFFWDDFAGRVGYDAPGIPEDWRERDLHAGIDGWNAVSGINAAMAELGGTVASLLTEEYVDADSAFEPSEDLPDY